MIKALHRRRNYFTNNDNSNNNIILLFFTRVSPPGTNFTADSAEIKGIKVLAQGHNILMQHGLNSRSLYPETGMTNMLLDNNNNNNGYF